MKTTRTITLLASLIAALGITAALAQSPGKQPSYDPRKDPLVNPSYMFEPPPEDRSRIASDETLYILLDASPNTGSIPFTSSTYEFMLNDALFAGLFTFDKDMKWMVNTDLVESFEESADFKTHIAKLKPGLKWHDGHPLTAHDVVFSWKTLLDPEVPIVTYREGPDQLAECVALDDLTVKFVHKLPQATRLWNIQFPIFPKHVYEKHQAEFKDLKTGDYYTELARHPIGNGPYKIVDWKELDKIVVDRWEEYPGPKPYFKRIVFKIIGDPKVALLEFNKGGLDAIRRLTPEQFAVETVSSEDFKRVGSKAWFSEWGFGYIGWNMDKSNPFFDDKRVRLAMTHALNLPRILDEVYYNLHTPCHGIFHPDSWMYNDKIELLGFDLEKAGELLDQAGWIMDEEDGWRYKTINGIKTPFEFTILLPTESQTSPRVAAIFQEDLLELGVRMKTATMEWSAFHDKIQNHKFEAQISAWGTGTDPDTSINLWTTKMYKEGRNYGGYSNADVDRWFQEQRLEFDPLKRAELFRKIAKQIYDDQPYTFLANIPTLSAFNKRIRGVTFSPRGVWGFDPSLYGWWVAKSEQLHNLK